MKRLLIVLLLLVILVANAQKWEKRTVLIDSLHGNWTRIVYIIQLDSVTCMKVHAGDDQWRLYTKFNGNAFSVNAKSLKIGAKELKTIASFKRFDPEGNIVEPILKDMKLTASDRGQSIGMGKYTANETLYITEYLKNEYGWVEMIAPLFFGGEYRVIIPCIPDNVK